jgi:hypothetical protein
MSSANKGSREFQRDNLSGVSFNSPWKFVLIPGAVIQWWLYMHPGRGFHGLAVSWRASHSPLMTYILSGLFWVVIAVVSIGLLVGHHGLS